MLKVVDKVTKFYLGSLANMNIKNIKKITDMWTDAHFGYAAHDFVSRHLPNAPTNSIFQYQFVHEGKESIFSISAFGLITIRYRRFNIISILITI